MPRPLPARARQEQGFTLIELLVVVAIIALLIAILLPTLSKARAQARTTLCLSRVGQLTKSLLLYCGDYDETPPFIATMAPHEGGLVPDPAENWLASSAELEVIHHARQEEWDGLLGKPATVPRSGTLFDYTRFEGLYKCPEFERITDPAKSQNVFNYTRPIWGRFWKLPIETGWESYWGEVLHILKLSQVHSPADIDLVLGEQWDRHVATAGSLGDNDSGYNCTDYGFFIDNIVELAHGAPVASRYHNFDHDDMGYYDPFLWKRGGVGYYDGHAGLSRDPWPTFSLGNNKAGAPFRMRYRERRAFHEYKALKSFMKRLIFAQRGFDPEDTYMPKPPWM
jgi:prepilin-type N-terminal cleavage/methylation domain-containing protein